MANHTRRSTSDSTIIKTKNMPKRIRWSAAHGFHELPATE